jgi:NmrA-like family
MADDGSILVTGATGQLGAVWRIVTGLILERGLPVRAMVRREDDGAAALSSDGAVVVVGTYSNRPTSNGSSAAVGGSSSACPFRLGTWRLA